MSTASGRAAEKPEKSPEAFRTISEVSEELGLPQHVLRFWETRFAQVKPMKRSGGRRLYRPDHVALLRGIKALLYDDGMTIKGVQKMLRESGARTVIARGKADAALSLEMTEPAEAGTDEAMLPLDLPEDAAERLAALKDRVSVSRAPARPMVDAERVRRSIDRLEALLSELEGGAGNRA
ncbi:MAG TPA: MerR family transcriptional regulator [Paracoccaceae bacterium]|nr:MerR family transcriptional regulator [Paracoccaceae bacterium]